jgi:hypothetical protein
MAVALPPIDPLETANQVDGIVLRKKGADPSTIRLVPWIDEKNHLTEK